MLRHREHGFTLIEALVAATLFAAAVMTLAQLLMRAADQSVRTERALMAATLAQDKLEALRAAQFAFDPAGARLDGAALAPSPAETLQTSVAGYEEPLGRFGELLPDARGAMFLRRWSISLLDGDVDTRLIAACVVLAGTTAAANAPSCVWAIRTRHP